MTSRPALRAARGIAAAAWSLLLAAASVSLLVTPASAAARTSSHTSAAFVLDDQSEWVTAPSGASASGPTPSSPFDLGLTARDAPSGALVEALLYPRLRSRFDFEKTVVRNGGRGYSLATTSPVALASLPPDPRAAGGRALDLSVVQGTSSGDGLRLGLACEPPTASGTCTGVYPVDVELQRPDGSVLHRFTTFLTYVAGQSAHPLDLAWVVPVGEPLSPTPHPSGPSRAVRPLSAAAASSLETLISQLHAASSVALTLDVVPQALQALDRAGPVGRAAVSQVASMSANPAVDEVTAEPYVPIDLGALAGAGEPTEIDAQLAAGATVLQRLRVESTTAPSPWVQTGQVGNDIASGLTQVHADQLVLPEKELAATSSATNSGTWASTFSLAISRGSSTTTVDAAETDTWLDGQFTADQGDPALAATQLLADLAMVHFERPNTTSTRGMVAVPPARWDANPTFDKVLLAGLTRNPVVDPVTLSGFFSSVTAAGTRQLHASGAGPVMRHSLATAVSRARVRLSDFDGAVVGRPPVKAELDDLLLASESDRLPAHRQAAGVSAFDRVLTGQLHLVRFATEKTVTLTARAGWIPVTVESRAPYHFVGTLSFSGNKFTFPQRGSHTVLHLDHATNAKRVDVVARTSGDLPLHVTFTSPTGRLVIARDLLTVRSTATSLVGVVLTVVALAILLTWWARTWRSGRRRRRTRLPAQSDGGAAAP